MARNPVGDNAAWKDRGLYALGWLYGWVIVCGFIGIIASGRMFRALLRPVPSLTQIMQGRRAVAGKARAM
jgi:hypothetical protein